MGYSFSEKHFIMNICIVDHKTLFAHSLKYLLASNPLVNHVGVYPTSAEFIQDGLSSDHIPDIVITDNKKNGSVPHLVYSAVLARFPQTKFIIITTNLYPDMVKESLMKGTLGYLTTDSSEEELFTAIDAVMLGQRYLSDPIKDIILKMLLAKDSLHDLLTPREMEVLKKIGLGRSQQQIAGELRLSVHTVRQFSSVLRKKLKVTRTSDLVVLAIEKGFSAPG